MDCVRFGWLQVREGPKEVVVCAKTRPTREAGGAMHINLPGGGSSLARLPWQPPTASESG
jgi:hypothetical protein